MKLSEIAIRFNTVITCTFKPNGGYELNTQETGKMTFIPEWSIDDAKAKLEKALNTIELDKMMDDTSEEDDFHKRKY